jgi:hypothetical protein
VSLSPKSVRLELPLKNEAKFRLASLAIFSSLAVTLSAGVQFQVRSPAPTLGADEVSVIQLPSTLETDAAVEVERINSKGFQPFVAGGSASDVDQN